MNEKKLKDPIYGYICIQTDVVNKIIDSAPFQRLRRITQTSYAPLYSSAVHNRFVHSIGVYNLGIIAGSTLVREIKKKKEKIPTLQIENATIDRLGEIFLLSCLLHDVGHAPFSHTGEDFYLEANREYGEIHELLKEAVDDEGFTNDIPLDKSKAAAPHEIMSAVVGLKEYCTFFQDNEERSFFARCITGYKYSGETTLNSIKNCFIQLLNSKIIDVDKLDYLIRDAYITGYNTVTIDYHRLLSAITVVLSESTVSDNSDSEYFELAYYKSAISVIENVVYAHDSERKWIQNHPIILYESYILQHIMKMLADKLEIDNKKLFSIESLSVNGQELNNGKVVRLLSDDDVIVLMKQYYTESTLINEYFDRRVRRHPIWKSESEYKAFFLDISSGGDAIDNLEKSMKETAEYLSKNTDNWVINDHLVKTIENELHDLPGSELDNKTKQIQTKKKGNILKVVKCLVNYAMDVGYSGDFVLIKASQFNSGFLKPDFSETKIVFPTGEGEKTALFGERVSSISGIGRDRDDFFYLFYKRQENSNAIENTDSLCRALIREFI